MITKNEALELLKKYNKEEFHIQHAETVSFVMEYFAKKLGFEDEVDFWGIVGLLHDIDFEMYPDEHCLKMQQLLRDNGVDEKIIRSAASHGYGLTDVEFKPEHIMEKILFATDELTGLIGASALVRPSKSTLDIELKSLKKKFKTPSFAAGCSREAISTGAEMLGWDLDYLLSETLEAMKEYEKSNN